MTSVASTTERVWPTRSAAAAPQGLYALAYRSHSLMQADRSEAELARILRAARVNNADLGVTGALMFHDDWFAQLLEGPEAAVRGLFDRILADPRHDGIEVLDRGPVEKRLFERWAMAYVGEHGEADTQMEVGEGVVPAADWRLDPAQDERLASLRQASRGDPAGSVDWTPPSGGVGLGKKSGRRPKTNVIRLATARNGLPIH